MMVFGKGCDSHRNESVDKHMTSISELRLLIYIVLFRSHALLTQVTPPAGLSKQLSGLRFVFVMLSRVEQIFLMKEKKANGCKINYTF